MLITAEIVYRGAPVAQQVKYSPSNLVILGPSHACLI